MYPIQILLVLVFLLAMAKVITRFKTGDLKTKDMLLWMFFWIIAIVVALLPDSTFYIARLVGVGRGVDLVVYISIIAIFFLVFRLMLKYESLNKDITKLARKLALSESQKEKDQENK